MRRLKTFAFPFAVFSCGLLAGVSATYFMAQKPALPDSLIQSETSFTAPAVANASTTRGPASEAIAQRLQVGSTASPENAPIDREFSVDIWEPENFGALRIRFRDAQSRWFDARVRSEFRMPYYDFEPAQTDSRREGIQAISKYWKAKVIHRFSTGETVEFELRYFTGGKNVDEDGVSRIHFSNFSVWVRNKGEKIMVGYGGGAMAMRYGKEYVFVANETVGSNDSESDAFQYFMAPLPGQRDPAMFLSVPLSVWHTTEQFEWEPVPNADPERFFAAD